MEVYEKSSVAELTMPNNFTERAVTQSNEVSQRKHHDFKNQAKLHKTFLMQLGS